MATRKRCLSLDMQFNTNLVVSSLIPWASSSSQLHLSELNFVCCFGHSPFIMKDEERF
jgi:hypothetical protein